MAAASRKLAMFLVPLMGGPPLYQQQIGPPRMRARHLPFVISEKERGLWLDCFFKVLELAVQRQDFPADKLPGFKAFLEGFSAWMVNSQG
jgi:hemoglobin